MAKNFRGTIYFDVDGTLCSAIRYQEKIWIFIDLNLMHMQHRQITCKNVQNNSFFSSILLNFYKQDSCSQNM